MPPKAAKGATQKKTTAAVAQHSSYRGTFPFFISPLVVASAFTLLYCGRLCLLTLSVRYDQRSYPCCESTPRRAFDVVARCQHGTRDHHTHSPHNTCLTFRVSKAYASCILAAQGTQWQQVSSSALCIGNHLWFTYARVASSWTFC